MNRMLTVAKKDRYRSAAGNNERGMVLVVTLIMIAALLLLGATVIMTSSTDIRISSNYLQATKAFYDADAGVQYTLAKARLGGFTWPTAIGSSVNVTYGTPSGFNFSPSITITRVAVDRYQFAITGQSANNAMRTVQAVFSRDSLVPDGTDGALAMYGNGPTLILKTGAGGETNVSGRDYPTPDDFLCSGSGCRTTGSDPAVVPGLYTVVTPTIVGDMSHVDGNPQTKLGGGDYNNQVYADLVNYIYANSLFVDHVLGTRDNPFITRIPSGERLTGNGDGAGILIIEDGGELFLAGNNHFEGLVILLGSGTLTGRGTATVQGSVITINHNAKTVDLNGTIDINYSSDALENLANINSMNSISLKSWRDEY